TYKDSKLELTSPRKLHRIRSGRLESTSLARLPRSAPSFAGHLLAEVACTSATALCENRPVAHGRGALRVGADQRFRLVMLQSLYTGSVKSQGKAIVSYLEVVHPGGPPLARPSRRVVQLAN